MWLLVVFLVLAAGCFLSDEWDGWEKVGMFCLLLVCSAALLAVVAVL
jgi:hypothetical protein